MVQHPVAARPAEAQAIGLNDAGVAAVQRGALVTAIETFRSAIASDPHYEAARYNLVGTAMLQCRILLSQGALRKATDIALEIAEDIGTALDARRVYGHLLIALSAQWRALDRDLCLDLAHRAATAVPEDDAVRTQLETTLVTADAPAQLSDYTTRLGEDRLGRHILIACFPKSGSTYLKNLLVKLSGFPELHLAYAFLQNEQELYLPYLVEAADRSSVVQQHCRATWPNVHILQGFGIRPVVLVRNIYDVLLSWKEFIEGGAVINTFFDHLDDVPPEKRLDLVIDDRAPWYFSFFAGWQTAARKGRLDVLWMTYERLTGDPAAALAEIAAFQGLEKSAAEIEAAITAVAGETSRNRLNKGVAGRGEAALSAEQKARIRRLASYYPGIDFGLIGLPPES